MSDRKIYVVGTSREYANWCEGTLTRKMEEASIVLFTGGEDVLPELYGKKKHPYTSFNRMRDADEVAEYQAAREMDKPLLGICRGAQFLCAMAGGILVQHMEHPYLHNVTTNDGRKVRVTSSHHQRQCIQGLDSDTAQLIAWAEHLSPYAHGENENDRLDEEQEAEIVFYPKIKALGIQSHPEWAYPCDDEWQFTYIAYCRELLNKYLVG